MTFRIIITREKSSESVRVSGRLAGAVALAELLHACESSGTPRVIDLSELRFADAEVLSALCSLRDKGMKLVGASPYINLLMRS